MGLAGRRVNSVWIRMHALRQPITLPKTAQHTTAFLSFACSSVKRPSVNSFRSLWTCLLNTPTFAETIVIQRLEE